ncbi:MAG TPA: serine protease, partial [Thermoanaerobaculia bacterium]|nr:serine protease [Thermoanaerobaculia bacterium]
AAVGNLGLTPGHPVLPPASAPSVLTVGGLDDGNHLHRAGHDIYHGSWGPTVDGLQKPEVIAPAIWVAAPILP